MMKIYFIQPMKGKTNEEILAERKEAEGLMLMVMTEKVKAAPKLVNDMEHGVVWNLGKSLQQMDGADMVALLPGWEEADGCRIEKAAADYYGFPQVELYRKGNGALDCDMGQASL